MGSVISFQGAPLAEGVPDVRGTERRGSSTSYRYYITQNTGSRATLCVKPCDPGQGHARAP